MGETNKLMQTLKKQITQIIRQENAELGQRLTQIETKIDNQNRRIDEILSVLKVETPDSPGKSNFINKNSAGCISGKTFVKHHEAPAFMNNRNPVSILNEKYTNVDYKVIGQKGPPHAPIFKVSITVENKTFHSEGSSKKDAFNKAAKNALQELLAQKTHREEQEEPPTTSVMVLNEAYPNVKWDCIEVGGDKMSRFQASVVVGPETFFASGPTKQRAKHFAAAKALKKLKVNVKNKNVGSYEVTLLTPEQKQADYIGKLIQDHFDWLMSKDPLHAKRKVLAGIVMTRDSSQPEVISLATGTKCIPGGGISENGHVLNDMHAEILSRRCLLNFFYDQLDLIANGCANKSIFTQRKEGRGYKLKPGVEFHMFISTAPCGDARVFTPHENGTVDKHPTRASRGLLRTKIEGGEGTIPVENRDSPQTWDGISQGNRLLTMSCSDKMCKWNVVGLQGALLTHFIEPVYLKTLVLGSLMDEGHLSRALYGRLANSAQFYVNQPKFYQLSWPENRQAVNSNSFSVVWGASNAKPEIIDVDLGKPKIGVSKFCKSSLAERFVGLVGKVSSISGVESREFTTYCQAKEAAYVYQSLKRQLIAGFANARLGLWVSKPIEQDRFVLNKP